ncbi:synaptic vesicular amine transporter-like [Amphiura filiformis]|uniref:synaptic vesicular amine transporter-like n=1 Tax=Amphiura filiformis TaxID=82378 RepID=UPI003B2249A8
MTVSMVTWLTRLRESRTALLVVVFIALFLDETLMTVIVPIIPDYLLFICKTSKCLQNGHLMEGEKCNYDVTVPPIESNITTPSRWTLISTDAPEDVNVTIGPTPNPEEICYSEITGRVGLLFASKFLLRIIFSPIAGYLTIRMGYFSLLFIGGLLMIASCLVFAIGQTYALLLVARMIHGVGATLNDVGGLGVLAYRYQDDEETRGFALGLAIGGFALGALIGPPFGALFYDVGGKSVPFLILAVLIAVLLVMEMVVMEPRLKSLEELPASPIIKLITDPQILVAAGALTVASMLMGLLEPSLPVWMEQNMNPRKWHLGAVFLPSGVAYIISSTIMGYLGFKLGRWSCCMISMVGMGIFICLVPFSRIISHLLGPMFGLGLFFGTVDSTMTGELNFLVDIRHGSAYGGAAAISTFAFSLGFAMGPSFSSFLTNLVGFSWMVRGLGMFSIAFAPLCLYLRGTSREGSSAMDERAILVEPHTPDTTVVNQTKETDSRIPMYSLYNNGNGVIQNEPER